MADREYVVVYEEPETGSPDDDRLRIGFEQDQVALHGELEVQTDFGIDTQNKAGATSLVGLVVTLIGTLVAVAAILLFSMNYPDTWYETASGEAGVDTDPVRNIAVLGVAGFLLLLVGNVLIHIGRRTTAKGTLRSIHVVERGPTTRLAR